MTQGFPLSTRRRWAPTLRAWLALGFVLVSVAMTLVATTQALRGVPSPGLSTDEFGTVLTEVLPGGPAWRSAWRVGDQVVSIDPGPTEETWEMEAERGRIKASAMVFHLRETIPLALVAAGLALPSLLLLPLGPPTAAAVAAVAVALTERTLMATGDLAWSTAGAVAAMALPGLWFVAFCPGRRWWRLLIGTLTAAVTGFWLWARFWEDSLFEVADVVRILLTYGMAIAIVVVVVGGAIRDARGGYDARRLGDVLFVALVAGILALAVLAAVPPEPLVLLVAIPLLAYPLLRGRLRQSLDRLLLGDLRSRASVQAVERERARLSREIHDDSLQRLAAVARRLDDEGHLAAEASALRSISGQLRDLSAELHPLILGDLGLAAALTELADRVERESGLPITVDLGVASQAVPPPPAPEDVELAVYRIAQEALGNAVRHSGAARVDLRGHVGPDRIELVVHDDGVGIDDVAKREAAARGRVGLHSMAERAELIGARLLVEPAQPGTDVVLAWPA